MRSVFKRITCLICAVLVLSGCIASAATKAKVKEEKLHEKYGFQETFKYSDEMIGHALKSSVPMVYYYATADITYRPIILDSDKFFGHISAFYKENGDTHSKEELDNYLYNYMRENIDDYIEYGSKKTVDAVCAGHGSGVVVSEDGYIVTNSHVACLTDKERMSGYINSLSESVFEELQTIVSEANDHGYELTEEFSQQIYTMLLQDAASNARVKNEKVSIRVYFPTFDGNTTLDAETKYYEAEVVAEGTHEGVEQLTQDMALIKIEAENLVALKLSKTEPEINSKISSGGYPASSDTIFSSAGSTAATLSISVTDGKVNSIKKIDGYDYNAIEIDSRISNGSSGGPSVDEYLDVEGLNTYGLSDDMRFAYMIPAAYVIDKTAKYEFIRDDVTKTFLTGLQMLQQNYGPAALECFEYVKRQQPDTPYIDNLISKAQQAPENKYVAPAGNKADGNDENAADGKEDGTSFFKDNLMWILIGGGAILLVIAAIVLVANSKKKRKKVAARASAPAARPVAPVARPTAPNTAAARPVAPPAAAPARPVTPSPARPVTPPPAAAPARPVTPPPAATPVPPKTSGPSSSSGNPFFSTPGDL